MVLPQIQPGVYWTKDRRVRTEDGADIAFRVLTDPDRPPGPAVALLGGFLCPDTWWHFLVGDLLADGYTVVLLHYRGLAQSSMPPGPVRDALSIDRYAQDVLDVLHAAGIHRVSLIGHSMGGQVMVEVARRIPDRVQSMTSVTGAWRSPTKDLYGQGWLVSPLTSSVLTALAALPGGVRGGIWRALTATVPLLPLGRAATAFGPRTPGAIIASYEAHLATLPGPYVVEALRAMHDHDPSDDVTHLSAPTLVIAGDGDPFTPAAVARRMVDRLPDARLLVVPDATHGAILEHPRVVGDAILAHLAATTGG